MNPQAHPRSPMKPIPASQQDFVVQFANVNGSGSASANRIVRTRHPEDGRAGGGAQHLVQLRAAHVVRSARGRAVWPAAAAGVDLLIALTPDVGSGRHRDRARRATFYDSTKPIRSRASRRPPITSDRP